MPSTNKTSEEACCAYVALAGEKLVLNQSNYEKQQQTLEFLSKCVGSRPPLCVACAGKLCPAGCHVGLIDYSQCAAEEFLLPAGLVEQRRAWKRPIRPKIGLRRQNSQ